MKSQIALGLMVLALNGALTHLDHLSDENIEAVRGEFANRVATVRTLGLDQLPGVKDNIQSLTDRLESQAATQGALTEGIKLVGYGATAVVAGGEVIHAIRRRRIEG